MAKLALTALLLLAAIECLSAAQLCIVVPAHYLSSCNAEINGSSTVKIIPVTNSKEFDVLIEFVRRAFARTKTISGSDGSADCREVIGVVGDLDLRSVKIIHTLASRANLSVTLVSAVAPSTFLPATNLVFPNLLHMNPLTHYVETLAAFLDHLNWTRIGMITDDTLYYEFTAELIQKKLLENPEREIVPLVRRISETENRAQIVQTFSDHHTDVIFISAGNAIACSLIQEAKQAGYVWPKYAWITLAVGLETCHEEGVVIFRDRNVFGMTTAKCGSNEVNISQLLLDSILAVTSAAEGMMSLINTSIDSQVVSFKGKRPTNISVLLTSSSVSTKEVAFYDTELQKLTIVRHLIDKPRGTILKTQFRHLNVTLGSLLAVSLLSAFVTIILILFICFRKEPEIKATSVTVSLCMFLGCYVLLLYLPLQVINPLGTLHCNTLAWPSLCGLPFQLIIATLFAKMLRIYLIFTDPVSVRSKLLSDPLLFLYILILVSPSLSILVIWSSVDPVTIHMFESPQDNFVFVHNRCSSAHTVKWLGALLVYTTLLSLVLMCLAIRTSKIRYEHFRDTKATNAFAYLSSFTAAITLIYFSFFFLQRLSKDTVLIYMIFLHVGHSSIVLLCQILLFIPKVYPPLKRRFA